MIASTQPTIQMPNFNICAKISQKNHLWNILQKNIFYLISELVYNPLSKMVEQKIFYEDIQEYTDIDFTSASTMQFLGV